MWYLPPFQGTRVILNPEGANYSAYDRSQAKGNAGTILTVGGGYMSKWHAMDEEAKKCINVSIKWDNGHRNSYQLGDVLPVDTDYKDFIYCMTNDGEEVHGTQEEFDAFLDRKLIKEGRRVERKTVVDQEYRATILKGIATKYRMLNQANNGHFNEYQLHVIEELSRFGHGLDDVSPPPVETPTGTQYIFETTDIISPEVIRRVRATGSQAYVTVNAGEAFTATPSNEASVEAPQTDNDLPW